MVPRAAKPSLAKPLNPSLRVTRRALASAVIAPPGVRRRVLRFLPPPVAVRAWSFTSMPPPEESLPPGSDPPPVVRATDRVAARLDAVVPAGDEVGNRVLPDDTRLVRWAAPVFLGCAIVLVPWIVVAAA